MDDYRIGIVIPAFNESATIGAIINSVKKYGTPIVVDDGSTDGTGKIALEAGAVLVSHGENKGYDFALNSGFQEASKLGVKIIVTIDADGQHDPSLIKQFVEVIDSGADVVIGVRNFCQRFAERLFAIYANRRFGIADPLCGMKAYRINVYKTLGHFDSYNSVGTELAIFAAKNSFRVDQIAFNIRNRADSPRFGRAFLSNCKIFRALIFSMM